MQIVELLTPANTRQVMANAVSADGSCIVGAVQFDTQEQNWIAVRWRGATDWTVETLYAPGQQINAVATHVCDDGSIIMGEVSDPGMRYPWLWNGVGIIALEGISTWPPVAATACGLSPSGEYALTVDDSAAQEQEGGGGRALIRHRNYATDGYLTGFGGSGTGIRNDGTAFYSLAQNVWAWLRGDPMLAAGGRIAVAVSNGWLCGQQVGDPTLAAAWPIPNPASVVTYSHTQMCCGIAADGSRAIVSGPTWVESWVGGTPTSLEPLTLAAGLSAGGTLAAGSGPNAGGLWRAYRVEFA